MNINALLYAPIKPVEKPIEKFQLPVWLFMDNAPVDEVTLRVIKSRSPMRNIHGYRFNIDLANMKLTDA